MKFFESDIKSLQAKIDTMLLVQKLLEEQGLVPEMPAINTTLKKTVILSHKVEAKLKKQTDGTEELEIKIAGYGLPGDEGGKWYSAKELTPYTEASRVLYLK